MSIYVGVNPDDLHRLRPVLSLFFQQAIGLQTRALPEHDATLKYQVLMMLDEFTALGRIPIIAEAVSYLPGYNVRVVLVIQTPAQLREVYGPNGAETMLKTLAARIVFAPKDFPDAREISDELGFTTVKVNSLSKPVFDLSDSKGRRQRSVSVSEQRRALLLPQEVKELGAEEAIIFHEGLRPIRCRKIRYFEDARFRARLLPPPKVGSIAAISRETPPAASDTHGVNRNFSGIAESAPTTRTATLADLDQIETLTLEDFAADFSRIEVPATAAGERLSEEALDGVVDSFLASLKDDGRSR
jgi:type IV secretion system protein VirD4